MKNKVGKMDFKKLTMTGGGGSSRTPTADRNSSTLADITSVLLTGLIETLIFRLLRSSSDSSDEESKFLAWLKSDQGSLPDEGGGGCLENPSSSTSGVGVSDFRTSSPSLPTPPSSSFPAFDFFFCLRFLRRKPDREFILNIKLVLHM